MNYLPRYVSLSYGDDNWGSDAEDHPWAATTLIIKRRAPAPVTGVCPPDLRDKGVLCPSPDPIKIAISSNTTALPP